LPLKKIYVKKTVFFWFKINLQFVKKFFYLTGAFLGAAVKKKSF